MSSTPRPDKPDTRRKPRRREKRLSFRDLTVSSIVSQIPPRKSGRHQATHIADNAGRKATEGLGILGQTYTVSTGYNTRGELTTLTYPDGGVVGRSYTDRGQLHQLTHTGAVIDTRTYDNGGRLTTDAYNNTVTETRTYNTDNTLASISFNKAIGNMTYGWDSNKNKTSETITGTMANYGFTVPSNVPSNGYDAEDRLVGFNRTAGLTQSWSLSPVGDWNSVATKGTLNRERTVRRMNCSPVVVRRSARM